jgi:hypothetical protein
MEDHLHLSAKERKTCLATYRAARQARRALILLLLAEGRSYRELMASTLAGPAMISAVKKDWQAGGVSRALGTEERSYLVPYWLIVVVRWLLHKTPRDFGFFRTRWSCALLALLLWQQENVSISPETVRRGLARMEFVWRRPRPVVGPRDPQRAAKLRRIQELIANLPADETVVFQDEVDVHLNPKIGCCWMIRGEQAEVVTPGNNQKRHLAGSLHWRTGRLILSTAGCRRNSALFIDHLDDLRRTLRCYRVIHVVCDNASFHNSRQVRAYLNDWGGRIVLHFLPKYAPETNPIERIWWHLHEDITRNHRCHSLDELLDNAYDWAANHQPFASQIEHFQAMYPLAA